MIRFLRYELKRSKGFFLILSFISLIFPIISAFLYKGGAFGLNNKDSSFLFFTIAQAIVILAMGLIYFAMRYKRDIFDKSSYITFTINIKVSSVLFAKLLATFILTFLGILIYVMSLNIMGKIFSIDIIAKVFSFRKFLVYNFVLGLYYTIAYLFLVLGISLSRVKIFKRYYNFVSIVLAIVVFALLVWIFRNIYMLNPLIFNLRNISIERIVGINGIDISMIYNGSDGKILGINLWTSILSFLTIAISFFVNEFLIEEKIDF